MPNWCENRLEITFDNKEQYADLVQKVFTDFHGEIRPQQDDFPFLDRLLPTPPEKLEVSDFSADGWYEWRTRNWGCKWDIKSPFFDLDEESLFISMSFDTPWSPPLLGVTAISQLYPSADFKIGYYEMGMGYAGLFTARDGITDDFYIQDVSRKLKKELESDWGFIEVLEEEKYATREKENA